MKNPTAVGCNIFAGLFTVGVKRAGFRVLMHLEHGLDNSDTAKANHPEIEMRIGGPTAWPEAFPAPPDLVFCNPPCAVWSAVGKAFFSASGINWRDDARLQRARDALALVERYRPKVWIWESVPRALTAGRSMILEMADEGRRLGYACSVVRFNARDVGVPQDRPRVFVVLHRYAFEPEALTTRDRPVLPRDVLKNLPRNAYAKDIERLSAGERALLPHVKPGQKLRRVFDAVHGPDAPRNERGHVIGRSPFPARRLHPDQPCPPMLQQLFHHKEDRHLSVAEALRLCGLPDDWKFGANRDKLRVLQQSVMPAVGEWIARAAMKSIKKAREVAPGPPLLYDLTGKELEITALGVAAVDAPKPARADSRIAPREPRSKPERPPREPRAMPTPDAIEKAKRVCASTTGSGARIRQLLLSKKPPSDDEIAAIIIKEFPGRKTTKSDVAWNRGMLRKANLLKE